MKSNIILGPFGLGAPEILILLVIVIVIIAIVSRLRRKKPGALSNSSNIYINNQAHANVQPSTSHSAADKLTQLKKLKDDGVISEEDYLKKKDEIMRSF
jgi:hypothetical protein